MGNVVDFNEARNSTCECRRTSTGELVCWSKGIIGTLSDEQEEKFCKDKVVFSDKIENKSQIDKFKMLGEISDKCLEKNISNKNFYSCIAREANKLRSK